ncbi:ABC transporter ATP-binding protein [Gordonia sp. HY285]|uniref:ABC transporter ATP-binding protein n=1 Tax=Gordonia liuliyuniae TaxID=2911517 RepID=A0ABS9ITX6_9ACTN|nr:ABC transporter ATP-binding protein [Gordonia liuliyuniae]MCF8588955.1 ABC transporter ATP-binding protein [Gordonia liuliyuniae]MCF8609164.1 ABC transporter ATP-binding protein [Gordonia liuliyuniae]
MTNTQVTADPALSFEHISQVYGGSGGVERFVALEDVSFEVPEGQFIAIVGASGCGKTTLLNMAAGLAEPTNGTVLVSNKPPRSPNYDLGYMFARDSLLPWRTARKNVALPLEARKVSAAERKKRADEMLALVGLAGKEKQFPAQLSQGMRQRVAIARTLVSDPEMLLMDEPFAALDARTRLRMQAEFLKIWEKDVDAEGRTRRTVFLVTHDLQEATVMADRVIVMLPSPGRIATDLLVDLPRPRAHLVDEIIFTERFREIQHELFEQLEGAVASSADAP